MLTVSPSPETQHVIVGQNEIGVLVPEHSIQSILTTPTILALLEALTKPCKQRNLKNPKL